MKQATSSAPALERGFLLLHQLVTDGQTSLETLAARNAWPKSSVLRCLQTLAACGAAEQDPDSRHWRALVKLTPLHPPREGILHAAAKRLPRLAEETGHCVELYQVVGRHVELTDRADPADSEISVQARIGFRRDLRELDATASLVYAFTETPTPEALWFWSDGERTAVSNPQRDRVLRRVRETGMGIDNAFNENGVRRFALPLRHGDSLVGILAVAQRLTPRFRADADRIRQALQTTENP